MNETAKRRKGKTARQPLRHFRDLDVVDDAYEKICAQLVRMIDEPEKWLIRRPECKR